MTHKATDRDPEWPPGPGSGPAGATSWPLAVPSERGGEPPTGPRRRPVHRPAAAPERAGGCDGPRRRSLRPRRAAGEGRDIRAHPARLDPHAEPTRPVPPGRRPLPARPHRPGAGRPLHAPAPPAPPRHPSRGRAQRRYATSRRTSASATGVPLRRAYVSRSRTSRGVLGRNPGPPQQLLWNPTPAFSSTVRARQAAMSRRRGAANADPTWIIGSAQRGQLRRLARSWGCLKEARQGRQTYEVFAWLTRPA